MIEIQIKGAVDAGNNEQVLMTEDVKYFQPSAIQRTDSSPFIDEDNMEYAVSQVFNRLVVGISTTNDIVKDGMYLVGDIAVSGDGSHTEMSVGEEKKVDSPVPYIMTLGMFAARAVQKAYEEDNRLSEAIKVDVQMATGLPVKEFNKEEGEKFAKRFTEHTYNVMVHLGYGKAVSVEINFEKVKVYSEASPVIFSLTVDVEGNVRDGEIYKEFNENYLEIINEFYDIDEIDGDFFEDKKVLHIDIGDGTTEFPITVGVKPDENNSIGENRGVGHVINRNLEEIADILGLSIVMRHNVSKILKDDKSIQAKRKRKRVLNAMDTSLKQEAEKIKNIGVKQMTKVQNDLDLVLIYGGGSIPLKDHLEPIFKEECDKREIPLLYIPKEFASTLYVEGLYFLLNSQLFGSSKKGTVSKKKKDAVK